MECYLKKACDFPADELYIPEEYAEFWAGMPSVLDQFDPEGILWAESPVRDEFMFTEAVDGVARVWGQDDEGRGWAGAPDILAYTKKGMLTLGDLKTSVKPYCRKGLRHRKAAKPGGTAWRPPAQEDVKQLAAYDCYQQTLGIK